jgi:hypothetical protein
LKNNVTVDEEKEKLLDFTKLLTDDVEAGVTSYIFSGILFSTMRNR